MSRHVKVDATGSGFTLSFNHPLADRANTELVAACFDELLACAEKNGCLDGRISLNEACLRTLAKHNESSGCISSCFGCG